MNKIYELAKKNYPILWNEEMIRTLVEKGRLTPEQFTEITGKEY